MLEKWGTMVREEVFQTKVDVNSIMYLSVTSSIIKDFFSVVITY
ncbi:hypothetical protein MKX62_22410 [Sporosarcina sp. FSL K6-5500]